MLTDGALVIVELGTVVLVLVVVPVPGVGVGAAAVPLIMGDNTYSHTRYAPTAIKAYLMMSSVFIIVSFSSYYVLLLAEYHPGAQRQSRRCQHRVITHPLRHRVGSTCRGRITHWCRVHNGRHFLG